MKSRNLQPSVKMMKITAKSLDMTEFILEVFLFSGHMDFDRSYGRRMILQLSGCCLSG